MTQGKLKLYTLQQAAEILGQNYQQVVYAIKVLHATIPLRAGRSTLLTDRNIKKLREHFRGKKS